MKFDLSKIKIKKIDLAKAKNINFSKMKKPSISKRELMMIGVLILALEGYVLFSSLLIPKWEQFSSVQKHYNNLKTQAKNVENEYAKKGQYEEQLKLLDYKMDKLTKELPPYVSQEDIILTLNKFANDRKLKIDQIAFGEISSVSKQDFAAGKFPSGQGENTGKGNTSTTTTSSAAKTATNAGKAAAQNAGEILIEEINLGFTGSYGALYNFMSDLEKSEHKTSIQGITMTRGNGNTLKGEIRVLYVGNNVPNTTDTYKLETPKIEGKDGPFTAYPGYDEKNIASTAASVGSVASANSGQNAGPVPVKSYDPNFYLILNTYDDNAPKIIIGDSSRDGTELYSNTNAGVRGKLSISGNQDNMTYSYSLGGTIQTKNAKLMIDGGKLRLEVSSLPRKNEKDKVSLTLDVDNKTDYPLEITVINDDKQAPRFSLGARSGSVTVK